MQSKAAALCKPSQTVIAARNQRLTRKSIQSSEYEHTKLIGTVIITPPTKEIKGEDDDSKKINTEQDWLKLAKNIPKDTLSLNDPNVHPRLIHKDGSVCHSKTYWASLNRKPSLKEFEFPDLFSDNEEAETPVKENSTLETTTNKSERERPMKRLNTLPVNTENTCTKTPTVDVEVGISDKIDTQGNEKSATRTVNTENNNDSAPNETINNTDKSDSVHTIDETDVNTENEPTKVNTTNIV